ncbi:hypothetical protein GCM10007304_30330 [Rhodococcoides trifolii]|uniref:Uncharacterized protein n=2 Tax=Rhodococcoides trifolii TaxID=908250 RepID=A0A917LCY4_9NOCA|nr:hypothetical protein GCM10007304_30330 [Rhodococcus trifolii]
MSKAYALTTDIFGIELGIWLWENKMIFPVDDQKQPAIRGSWKDYNSEKIPSNFAGLAVRTNDKLHIVDIDRPDWVQGNPNILTTKGAHYWYTPVDGVKNTRQGDFDLLTNAYGVFWGKGKEFQHSELHEWGDLTKMFPAIEAFRSSSNTINELFDGITYGDSLGGLTKGINCRTLPNTDTSIFSKKVGKKKEITYPRLVEDSTGFVVDVNRYRQAQVTQMENVEAGKRNNRLFRSSLEFHRLGLDTTELEKAALVAGLDQREASRTIASAYARWEDDEGTSPLDRVAVWLGAVEATDPTDSQWDVAQYVARCALEQHSLAPQVSQTRAARDNELLSQRYAGTVLNTTLVKRGLVKKIVRPGKQANGLDHCNNYHLLIDGIPLEYIDVECSTGAGQIDGRESAGANEKAGGEQ